jgi:hemerythrin-like domain-containing protein
MPAAKPAFPGFDTPAAGFEAPLEMLAACHGRVERQCQTLLRLVPHLATHGPDRAAREAAQSVMRYFDTSAPHHHADEEADLFPALLQNASGGELPALRELVAALQAQHRELEQSWGAVRRQLEGVCGGTLRALDAGEVGQLVELYRSHIEREETELLPLAARILGTAKLDRVGRAMRLRRGIEEI